MVTESPWYEVDFLSKIPHFKNGRVYLTRDYSKRLTQGIQYSGRERILLHYDGLYFFALLQGLKTEKASRLLEDLTSLEATLSPTDQETIAQVLSNLKIDAIRYALGRQDGYEVEEEINHKLGIGIGTLWSMYKSKTYSVVFGKVRPAGNVNNSIQCKSNPNPATPTRTRPRRSRSSTATRTKLVSGSEDSKDLKLAKTGRTLSQPTTSRVLAPKEPNLINPKTMTQPCQRGTPASSPSLRLDNSTPQLSPGCQSLRSQRLPPTPREPRTRLISSVKANKPSAPTTTSSSRTVRF